MDTGTTGQAQVRMAEIGKDQRWGFGPWVLLRVEGLILFALTIWLYAQFGVSWWLFVILLLAPDVSMLGYLAGPRVGAAAYNVFHHIALPTVLAVYGILSGGGLALALALIWFAHIMMDRAVGYGFKYSTAFKDTHLNRV